MNKEQLALVKASGVDATGIPVKMADGEEWLIPHIPIGKAEADRVLRQQSQEMLKVFHGMALEAADLELRANKHARLLSFYDALVKDNQFEKAEETLAKIEVLETEQRKAMEDSTDTEAITDKLTNISYSVLKRNYPDLTEEMFIDLVGNYPTCGEIIKAAMGFERGVTDPSSSASAGPTV